MTTAVSSKKDHDHGRCRDPDPEVDPEHVPDLENDPTPEVAPDPTPGPVRTLVRVPAAHVSPSSTDMAT